MAYAMFVNLFLHGAEAFKEYYSNTEHLLYTRYWFQGIDGHRTLVPFAWTAVSLNVLALVLFVVPRTRSNWSRSISAASRPTRAATSRRAWD